MGNLKKYGKFEEMFEEYLKKYLKIEEILRNLKKYGDEVWCPVPGPTAHAIVTCPVANPILAVPGTAHTPVPRQIQAVSVSNKGRD